MIMRKKQNTWIWIALGLIVLILAVRFLLPYVFRWNNYVYPHMFAPMMFPVGIMGMVLFWGMIIFLVYRLLISDKGTQKYESEIEILKKRLAGGEITIEEYERIIKTLKEEK